MAIKKEKVKLTYDALWFKIFMDSYDIKFYSKEIFITPGLKGNRDLFMQMLGNLGAYARTYDFDKDIDVVVFSDKILNNLSEGEKVDFVNKLEDKINASNTPYRKLKFTTESLLLDFIKTRASGHLKQTQKSLSEKDNTVELNISLEYAIEKDEVMLSMLKKYKVSSEIPQQQELF